MFSQYSKVQLVISILYQQLLYSRCFLFTTIKVFTVAGGFLGVMHQRMSESVRLQIVGRIYLQHRDCLLALARDSKCDLITALFNQWRTIKRARIFTRRKLFVHLPVEYEVIFFIFDYLEL